AVATRYGAERLVGRQQLHVGLDHRRVTADQLHFFLFLSNDLVKHLVERAAALLLSLLLSAERQRAEHHNGQQKRKTTHASSPSLKRKLENDVDGSREINRPPLLQRRLEANQLRCTDGRFVQAVPESLGHADHANGTSCRENHLNENFPFQTQLAS